MSEGLRKRLPEAFLACAEEGFGIPGFDRDAFLSTYDEPACSGLRLNTAKVRREDLPEEMQGWDRVPWTEAGFYPEGKERWTRHPLYYAGLYYSQEPSAMAPAEFLPVAPGDRVLDLCAAPGGKSTRLAERLAGKGFLLANDISASRARALLKNLELFGAGNIFVTGETPEKLAEAFAEGFDRILVDAPCSGEGMFRKDPSLIRAWEERGPEEYVPLQRQILGQAVRMLAPGGYLLYSTCTFSRKEDEENILWLLAERPDLEAVPLTADPVKTEGFLATDAGYRLFPHLVRGEGHFLSLLRRKGDRAKESRPAAVFGKEKMPEDMRTFLAKIARPFSETRLYKKGEDWYYLPEGSSVAPGLRYLRTGLYLGEEKKGRFSPSQALAMWLSAEDFSDRVSFDPEDERVIRYLKGETIDGTGADHRGADGWCLVCAGKFPLGFSKRKGTQLKNKYYVGWRWQ